MSPVSLHILGVTGSVGQSAMDVVLAHPDRFDVRVVSAHQNVAGLAAAAMGLRAKSAVIADSLFLPALEAALYGSGIACFSDFTQAFEQAGKVDTCVAAIVGMVGLEPLMQVLPYVRAIAIANKEPLVAAGAQFMEAARAHGCTVLPVDSEHNAVFQVFDPAARKAVQRIILTASGGPFRTWSAEAMRLAMPAQAVQHPNWSMGAKISVDSATMMNKALEIIEASVLFDLPPEQIDVLIHPQSVVHGMVEYVDGSVLAQMGASDMRTPLSNVMAWPERLETCGRRLDLAAMAGGLEFDAPDHARFPAIGLAYEALRKGQYACVALNAANEVAVEAFLQGDIGFTEIVEVVRVVVQRAPEQKFLTISEVISYDRARRADAVAYIDFSLHKDKDCA